MVFGGFTVDEETRASGRSGGGDGTDAAALFTNNKEEREIARATGEKRFGGQDHRGNDALGIAGAAAVDVWGVFARGEKRRDGVHVRGEGDIGFAERDEQVVAIGLGGLAIEAGVVFYGERRKKGKEIVRHGLFVACGGVNVHQR